MRQQTLSPSRSLAAAAEFTLFPLQNVSCRASCGNAALLVSFVALAASIDDEAPINAAD